MNHDLQLLLFNLISITLGFMIGSWMSHSEQKRSENKIRKESDSWPDFR